MNIIPFRTQYDKIVSAYIKNELNPTKCNACFVGNLLNNKTDWAIGRTVDNGIIDEYNEYAGLAIECVFDESKGSYTREEVVALERIFLSEIMGPEYKGYSNVRCNGRHDPNNDFEERLFRAMEITLLALKELHESKGDVVEPYNFTKRQLERQSI